MIRHVSSRLLLSCPHIHALAGINVKLFLWDTIEINVIISAACIAILRPLTRKLLGLAISEHESPAGSPRRSFIPINFGGFRRNKQIDSEFDLETRYLGPRRAPSEHSLGSMDRAPSINGKSRWYSSDDLSSLSSRAQEISRNLGSQAPGDTTHRFETEGYA